MASPEISGSQSAPPVQGGQEPPEPEHENQFVIETWTGRHSHQTGPNT
jgi:hypothetical protein